MEEVKQIITEYWPEIVSYFATFVGYFLIFLFRSKISGTQKNLIALYRETTDASTKENAIRQKEMRAARKEFLDAKREYEEAVKRLKNVEDALNVLLEDTEVLPNDEEN